MVRGGDGPGKKKLLNVCDFNEFLKKAVQPLNHFAVPKNSVAFIFRYDIEAGACESNFPPQYLCDGAADCSDGYDEDPRLCTAGS